MGGFRSIAEIENQHFPHCTCSYSYPSSAIFSLFGKRRMIIYMPRGATTSCQSWEAWTCEAIYMQCKYTRREFALVLFTVIFSTILNAHARATGKPIKGGSLQERKFNAHKFLSAPTVLGLALGRYRTALRNGGLHVRQQPRYAFCGSYEKCTKCLLLQLIERAVLPFFMVHCHKTQDCMWPVHRPQPVGSLPLAQNAAY